MATNYGVLRSLRAVRAERDAQLHARYGGVSLAASFMGFLVAAVLSVLFLTLAASFGAATLYRWGSSLSTTPGGWDGIVVGLGPIGAATALVSLFVAFLLGGYTAGRMTRFDGAQNGLGVFAWSLILLLAGAAVGLANRSITLRDPTGTGIALLMPLGAMLLGAVLGGGLGSASQREVNSAMLGDGDAEDLTGALLMDEAGRAFGRVSKVYVGEGGSAQYLKARLGTLSPHHRLLPATGLQRARGRVQVPFTRQEVLGSPDASATGEVVESALLDRVSSYYDSLRNPAPAAVSPSPAAVPSAAVVTEGAALPPTVVRDNGDVVDIPIVEEELVKRPVVKEVLRVRKTPVSETQHVDTDLRKDDVQATKEDG
ncbi:MAG TPA: hypothetical protein VGN26_10825 [Armatimonadota bacterium]|jgi:hypothetical protein